MFGGTPQRNQVNTFEKNMPTEWSVKEGERKNIKWVAELGSTSYGVPVIAGGKVYVGTNNQKPRNPKIKGDKGILMCFRESDGQFLWQAVHDKLPSGMENDWPQQGIASSPVVEKDRLYYVSNRCEVICADTEGFLDGKNDGVQDEKYKDKTDADIVWRLDMIKDLGVFPRYLCTCSPALVGELLYVVTANGKNEANEVPAPKAPSFLAINKNSGKVVWQDASPGEKIIDGQWSNPACAVVNGKPQVIFPGGDGWLRGFDAQSGKPIWKLNCNPKSATPYTTGGKGTQAFFLATPVIYDNKVYVALGQEPENDNPKVGHLWCVDITKTGDLTPVKDNFDPKDPANKDSGLVWHYGGDAPKGEARDYMLGHTLSTCAIQDGLLYVAELDGYLHCLDAKTGKKYWEHDLKSTVWASPYSVDGKVYLGNDDGDVYIFAHGKEKKLLGKIEMGSLIRGPVVASNGVLYVMTSTHLYAIASR